MFFILKEFELSEMEIGSQLPSKIEECEVCVFRLFAGSFYEVEVGSELSNGANIVSLGKCNTEPETV